MSRRMIPTGFRFPALPTGPVAEDGVRASLLLALLAALAAAAPTAAQEPTYLAGQSVSPAYEGWTEDEDGSRHFLFGYMNRNWAEELDVPIGPDNRFSPGQEDRGQPAHFLPRRNRYVFKVPVPPGFDEGDELVWTLRTNGETRRAYATLNQDFFVDNVLIMSETGALGNGSSDPVLRANRPPAVELLSEEVLTVNVGEPLTLAVRVTDDGVPERDARSAPLTDAGEVDFAQLRKTGALSVGKINGLFFAWFPYRGPRTMSFDPLQIKVWEDTRSFANSPWSLPYWIPPELPQDNLWVTQVTFHETGTYVLRGRADDGGLYADVQVTVHVIGGERAS